MRGVKLTPEMVKTVFLTRFSLEFRNKQSRTQMSRRLATDMDVSMKTIRDIWNGRSWLHVTNLMDMDIGSIDQVLVDMEAAVTPFVDPFASEMAAMYMSYVLCGDEEDIAPGRVDSPLAAEEVE